MSRNTRRRLFAILIAAHACAALAFAQAPAPGFDVVSIRRNTAGLAIGVPVNVVTWRPNGALTMTNVNIALITARAFPDIEVIGLPEWARTERFDVSATSSLSRAVTPDERLAMLRALLADRFKLVTRIEKRRQPVYELVLARADRTLGGGMKPSDVDCARIAAERNAAAEAALAAGTPPPPSPRADFNAPLPPCTMRSFPADLRRGGSGGAGSHLFEAESTLDELAKRLRNDVDRPVINRTALAGSYRVTMTFDSVPPGLGNAFANPSQPSMSVFTALPEQLGLKLEATQAELDTLVVVSVERPVAN